MPGYCWLLGGSHSIQWKLTFSNPGLSTGLVIFRAVSKQVNVSKKEKRWKKKISDRHDRSKIKRKKISGLEGTHEKKELRKFYFYKVSILVGRFKICFSAFFVPLT